MPAPTLPGPEATAAAAGGRGGPRFWRTVLVFAVLNLAAWIVYDRALGPRRLGLLRVDQFAPGVDATLAEARPTLTWKFNLDVAPSPDNTPPGLISPPVAGRWRWDDARTLAFTPSEDLPRATRFTLTLLPDRIRTAQGISMLRPFVAPVRTPAPRVVQVRQRSFDERERYVLEIEFSDDVSSADVIGRTRITCQGKKLDFTEHGSAGNVKVVRVLTDSILPTGHDMAATLLVHVDAGVVCTAGPLAMEQPFEQPLQLDSVLAAVEARAWSPMRDRPQVRVRFNGEVDLQTLRPLISVDPPVSFTPGMDGGDLKLAGDFSPGARYAIKIARSTTPGTHRAARAEALSVFVPDRRGGVWFEHREGYLSTQGNRTLLAHAVNVASVKVTLWQMYANNLVAWRTSTPGQTGASPRIFYGNGGGVESFAQPIATKTISLDATRNRVNDVRTALDDLLGERQLSDGVYQVTLEATAKSGKPARRYRYADDYGADDDGIDEPTDSAVVTLSDVGLTAKKSGDAVLVWAVSLAHATPMPGTHISVFSDKSQPLGDAVTDESGVARVENVHPAAGEHVALVVAAANDANKTPLTWLDLRSTGWNLAGSDVAGRAYLRDGYEAFVYSERGVYRPGETVHLRAIVRGPDGAATPTNFPMAWRIQRPDLREWKTIATTLDADGGAGADVALPDDVTTGKWTASIALPGDPSATSVFGSTSVQVEEFMPARLKAGVTLRSAASTQPLAERASVSSDDSITAHVRGDYLFGRPAAGLTAAVSARIDPTTFAPEAWKGWTFGDAGRLLESPAVGRVAAKSNKSEGPRGEITLDAKGEGAWTIPLDAVRKPQPSGDRDDFRGPWKLGVAAEVREEGGRAVTAATSSDLDTLPWYVGVRPRGEGSAVPGKPATFDARLIDPTGKATDASTQLQAALFAESWNNTLVFDKGRYRYESTRVLDPVNEAVAPRIAVENGTAAIEVTAPSSGSYVLRLRDRQSGAMTSIAFVATDGSPWADSISRENPEKLELSIAPQGRPLKVGEAAQVLVKSPFAGRLLLAVETDRVLQTHVIEMVQSHVDVPVEIPADAQPNAYITATVVRGIEPDAKWRVHRAYGAARVRIDESDRRLNVAIATPPEIRPRSRLQATLRVTDASGRPVPNAAVTLAAVDEGVLQLTSFATPDPLKFFTADRALGVDSSDLYSLLMPEVPKPQKLSQTGGDGDVGTRYRTPVTAKRVKPVALFAGPLHTDATGVATSYLDLPEFTGKLRLMAVAYAGRNCGNGEASVLVRGPLIVQSSFPRFAAPGDRFLALITVMNNSAVDGQAKVSVELGGGNVLALADDSSHVVHLAPRGSGVALASFNVGNLAGVARVRVKATMGDESAEENVELPVRPASPTITEGAYALVTPGQPLKLPLDTNMLAGTVSFRVGVTPWPSLQLPRGLEYLERYPYGCAEQTISTSFPLLALRDIGPKIVPGGVFDGERVKEKVQVGITRLLGMQTSDGGIAMWPGDRAAWPWASVYAAHFLVEAEAAGHAVPADLRDGVLAYVRRLLDKSADDAPTIETQAYGCYVLALAARPAPAAMSRLGEISATAPASRLHLAMAQLLAGRRDLAAPLLATKLIPRTSRESGGSLGSPARDRAIQLEAMIAATPDSPELPVLAQQLADEGAKGQWRSTQDCAFAVMALGKYLRSCKSSAAFDRAVLLAGERQLASSDATLQWSDKSDAHGPLLVRVTGPADARGHVSWIRSGVPLSPPANADNGMKVRRAYADVAGKPLSGNTVRSGDLVRVTLDVDGPAWQKNLVVEDLLPAGLEVENPRLDTSARANARADARANATASSGDVHVLIDPRVDYRDDRVIVAGSLGAGGDAQFTYLARAVAPGEFVIPPVRGECMYDTAMNSIYSEGGPNAKLVVQSPHNVSLARDE